jgi:hypothetical protein
MTTALTYRTCEKKSALRTVLVEDVRKSVVLLPTGRMDVVLGKLLHGPEACAHEFWDAELGTGMDSDDFVIAADQVVQIREMAIAVKVERRKSTDDSTSSRESR